MTIWDSDEPGNDVEYHRHTLAEALCTHNHHTLQTVQADVFVGIEHESVMLEVQFHFVRGSEGKLVAAQKSDRPEFWMKRLVSFDI